MAIGNLHGPEDNPIPKVVSVKHQTFRLKLIGAAALFLLSAVGFYFYRTRNLRDPSRLVYHDSKWHSDILDKERPTSKYILLPGNPARLSSYRRHSGPAEDKVELEQIEIVPGPKPAFRRQLVATLRQKKSVECDFAQRQDGQWFQLQTEVLRKYRKGSLLTNDCKEEADEAEVEFIVSKMDSAKNFQEVRRWRRRDNVCLFQHLWRQGLDGFYSHFSSSNAVWRIDYQGQESLFPIGEFGEEDFWDGKLLLKRKASISCEGGETKAGPDWSLDVLEPGTKVLAPLAGLPKFRLPGDPELFDSTDKKVLVFQIQGKAAVSFVYAENDYLAYPEANGTLKSWRKDPWGVGHDISQRLVSGPDGEQLIADEEIGSRQGNRLRLFRLDLKTGQRYQAELDESTCPILKPITEKVPVSQDDWGAWERRAWLRGQCTRFGLHRVSDWLGRTHWWDYYERRTNHFSDVFCMPASDLLVLRFVNWPSGSETITLIVQRIDWHELGPVRTIPATPVPTAQELSDAEKRRRESQLAMPDQ